MNVGGLRSGWGQFTAGKLVLHGYSYVPGVTVSGEITAAKVEAERRRRGGRARLSGRLGPRRTLTGLPGGGHEVKHIGAQAPLWSRRRKIGAAERDRRARSGTLAANVSGECR